MWWPSHLLNLVIIVLGLLLMLIVLIQRGKGGGLAGAFGGAGGSSPFGSRAADQFVKITLWLAGVWVLVIMIHVKVVKYDTAEETKTPVINTGEVIAASLRSVCGRPRSSFMRPTGVLLSMTGFGESRTQAERLGVAVEVRALNNRHLKVTVRGTDPYPMFEAEIEKVVRRHVRRGTITVHVRVERAAPADRPDPERRRPDDLPPADSVGVRGRGHTRIRRLHSSPASWRCRASRRNRGTYGTPPDDEWPVVEQTLDAALRRLDDDATREEGQAMGEELLAHHRTIIAELDALRELIPGVTADYRQRLLERVRQAVARRWRYDPAGSSDSRSRTVRGPHRTCRKR